VTLTEAELRLELELLLAALGADDRAAVLVEAVQLAVARLG